MGTQVASKPGEPLELVKEDIKLSHDTSHHANKRKSRLNHTSKCKSNESVFISCQNRFEPLMGSDSMDDDFDTISLDTHACDAVTYDAEQSMDFSEIQSTGDWDKFDKELAEKKLIPL